MPIEVKRELTDAELKFGRLLLNRLWFLQFFWKEELTIPDNRPDLPEEWIGEQIISVEQKMMALDQSDKILFCTGRKVWKCVAGDTIIYDALTGEGLAVSEICDKQRQLRAIATLDGWKVKPTTEFSVFENEATDLYRVSTRSGLSINVSGNHPFLTGVGWVDCSDLAVGDLIGVARRSPMPPKDTSGLSDAAVALLAYLIGDGGITQSVIFTTTSPVILADFSSWVSKFDSALSLKPRGKHGYAVTTGRKGWHGRNKLLNLLREVGLAGKGSYDKFVPAPVFRLNQEKLALFLSRLYATDGNVTSKGIGYTSMSRRLIDDIRELLLRFGIFARAYASPTWMGTIQYNLVVLDSTDVLKFINQIGVFSKEERIQECAEVARNSGLNKHDRIPLELVRATIFSEGLTPYTAGINAGLRFKGCYQPSRDKVNRVATANGLEALGQLAQSDVYWDEIKSIEPAGIGITYDLSVADTHNFVANGIITHNSTVIVGAIMQIGITYARGVAIEALLVTPGQHHLIPLQNRLEIKIDNTPFFDIMMKNFNKSKGTLTFHSGLTWYWRVEGQRGRGESQVSLVARYLIGDEMAFGDEASHEARQQTIMPGAMQILAGVPNGIRASPFYRLDQTSAGDLWSRHKYETFINPLYQSDKAREEEEAKHGGINTQGYITQVLGEWGKEAFSSFPRIPYISMLPFRYIELTEDIVNANLNYLPSLLPLPVSAVRDPQAWILGGDLGYSPAPTVLFIFYLKQDVWYELGRIKLLRCNPFNQARIIDTLNCQILPERLSVIMLDLHGAGSAVMHCLLHDPFVNTHDDYARKTIDANFAGRIDDPNIKVHSKCNTRLRMVERNYICDKCGVHVWKEEEIRNARVPVKQHYTTLLKDAFAFGQIYIDGRREEQ